MRARGEKRESGQNGARISFIENGVRCTTGSRVSQPLMDVQCKYLWVNFCKTKILSFSLLCPHHLQSYAKPALDQ